MPCPPKRRNLGWGKHRKGKRRGTGSGRRRQTAADGLLELTHTTPVEQETAEAADAATRTAAAAAATGAPAAAQQAATHQAEAEEDAEASPSWLATDEDGNQPQAAKPIAPSPTETNSSPSEMDMPRSGRLAGTTLDSADGAPAGSGESAPVPAPGSLGMVINGLQDGPPQGPPSVALDWTQPYDPQGNVFECYDDLSDDHERVVREACESWLPHDRMLTLIDRKVVFHGKVVGCSHGSKTCNVEIWEYCASAVTKRADAILEVPLRMVINAFP